MTKQPPFPYITLFMHAALWGLFLAVLLAAAPRMVAVLQSFNFDLPAVSVFVARVTVLAGQYWYGTLAILVALLVVDGLVLALVQEDKPDDPRGVRWAWSVGFGGIPLVLAAGTLFALWVPMFTALKSL